jgi:hypothetical protein
MPRPRIYNRRERRTSHKRITYPVREKITTETHYPGGVRREVRTAEYKTESRWVPNFKNGNWETTFQYGLLRIRHAIVEDRCWLFYGEQCLCELSRFEQYEIGKRWLQSIGGLVEVIHDYRNGKPYRVMKLMAESTFKGGNSRSGPKSGPNLCLTRER